MIIAAILKRGVIYTLEVTSRRYLKSIRSNRGFNDKDWSRDRKLTLSHFIG